MNIAAPILQHASQPVNTICDHVFVICKETGALLDLSINGARAMQIVVFDLDGTVIDSSHRHLNKPCGSIDLDHWLENCTREKIMQDSLLPLAQSMRRLYAAGHHIVVCTARVMSEHDYAFLAYHGLNYHACLSREGENDRRPDGPMKVQLLTEYVQTQGYRSIAHSGLIMFDDNLKVIAHVAAAGALVFNAAKENARQAMRV